MKWVVVFLVNGSYASCKVILGYLMFIVDTDFHSCFTFTTDIPASGMYFASYEWLKNALTPPGRE